MFAVVKPYRANQALHIGLLITAIILSLLSITSNSAEDINCGTHTFASTTSTFIVTPAIGGIRVIYVDADATGINNGDSRTNAFTNVQDALNIADAEDEIWVASGKYTPTCQSDLAGPRTATFQMKNGVAIYGGFDPSVGADEFTERDWENNATVLSGDIGVKGDNSDNCCHVFYHLDDLELNTSAILDGFTISDGNSSVYEDGGGMYNRGASPTVINCKFKENRALCGSGMYNSNASPIVTKCTFNGNRSGMHSGGGGGAMYNDNSSPTVADCSFSNKFSSRGVAIRNYNNSSPTITNCDF